MRQVIEQPLNDSYVEQVDVNDLQTIEDELGWDCQDYIAALEDERYGENPTIILHYDGTAYLRAGWNARSDNEVLLDAWHTENGADVQAAWNELVGLLK